MINCVNSIHVLATQKTYGENAEEYDGHQSGIRRTFNFHFNLTRNWIEMTWSNESGLSFIQSSYSNKFVNWFTFIVWIWNRLIGLHLSFSMSKRATRRFVINLRIVILFACVLYAMKSHCHDVNCRARVHCSFRVHVHRALIRKRVVHLLAVVV